jgi:hypothetical protein
MGFFDLLLGRKNKSYFRSGLSVVDRKVVVKKWDEIQELIRLGNPSRFRSAVVEADKLLDFVLDKMGYTGNLGDKLKMTKDRFVDGNDYSIYDGVWQAHKCRNQIVHEVSYELLSSEAYDVVNKFGNGLRKLGSL